MKKIDKSDKEWKEELSPEEYEVLRKGGTEKAFTGKYLDMDKEGSYLCKACGNKLFSADAKFKSGTGWPSFTEPVEEGKVELKQDTSGGMVRTEVVCAKCGSHLGHVFDDGPEPTDKRYCINSICLEHKEPE